jgi:hypothetical protein
MEASFAYMCNYRTVNKQVKIKTTKYNTVNFLYIPMNNLQHRFKVWGLRNNQIFSANIKHFSMEVI